MGSEMCIRDRLLCLIVFLVLVLVGFAVLHLALVPVPVPAIDFELHLAIAFLVCSFIHSLQVTIKTKLLSFLFVVVRRGCWWQTWGSGADQNRTAGVVQLHVAVQHVQPRGGPRSGRGQPQDGHGGLLPRLVHHGSRHRSFERISHRLRAQGFAGFSAGVHGETVKNIVS